MVLTSQPNSYTSVHLPLAYRLNEALKRIDLHPQLKKYGINCYGMRVSPPGLTKDVKGRGFGYNGEANLVLGNPDIIAVSELTERPGGILLVETILGIDGVYPWLMGSRWERALLHITYELASISGFRQVRVINPFELIGVQDGGLSIQAAKRRYYGTPRALGFKRDENSGEYFRNIKSQT